MFYTMYSASAIDIQLLEINLKFNIQFMINIDIIGVININVN